ncbi:hypothetical protein [Enterococcus pallens]|uniref:Alternate signal-mediated exported protein n=1 Tax=Enterococcus pallens ATCC BAA-351 TaxID=1158607 RepID=R2QL69_9ENTE|nr:hypothetical protein [Enterococcus pallens]EOH97342.1 alternate signal-mediated exported protein [Enterococcus pallens ATCC BAA-351]EOU21239.1 hypothetical protein I588_02086 [Enterococcus pallens ATCC BAA-351]
MKKNSKKKKLMAAAAALALIAAISGTFAWITAQDQRINRAESAAVSDNSVTVKETWEPKPLVPGTEATKEVAVSNTGTASVFVRVSYEEVLKHLDKLGAEKYDPSSVTGAKYTYVANDSGLNKHMPINFNGDQTYKDGFVQVPAGQITGLATPADDNAKLLVKGGKTVDPVTGAEKISYEAKMMHEYFTHTDNNGKNPGDTGYDASKNKYQSMTFDISVTNENSKLDAKDWNFALTNVKYGYYENGYKNTTVNWAKSSLPDEDGAATGRALLGTDGVRYSVDYDYTFGGLGYAAATDLPAVTPATVTNQIPTATGKKDVQADTKGLGKSEIKIGYSADVTDIATLGSDKWVYNKDDGWFYYTVPVKSGETTKNLLEKLVFESAMGTEYTNASYDLVVKMEAVQANADALTDSAGWELGGGSTPTGDTLAIVNKLKAGI